MSKILLHDEKWICSVSTQNYECTVQYLEDMIKGEVSLAVGGFELVTFLWLKLRDETLLTGHFYKAYQILATHTK